MMRNINLATMIVPLLHVIRRGTGGASLILTEIHLLLNIYWSPVVTYRQNKELPSTWQ